MAQPGDNYKLQAAQKEVGFINFDTLLTDGSANIFFLFPSILRWTILWLWCEIMFPKFWNGIRNWESWIRGQKISMQLQSTLPRPRTGRKVKNAECGGSPNLWLLFEDLYLWHFFCKFQEHYIVVCGLCQVLRTKRKLNSHWLRPVVAYFYLSTFLCNMFLASVISVCFNSGNEPSNS